MKTRKISLLIATFILAVILSGCAIMDSYSKSIESDTKGLPRTITVYSVTGEELASYSGDRVRIEEENGETAKVSVLLDGKRISFHNAIVIVEEQ